MAVTSMARKPFGQNASNNLNITNVSGAHLSAEDDEAFYYAVTSNATVTFSNSCVIDAMWIGGGGGGATTGIRSSGGAGAGGLLVINNYSIPAGSYPVTIGAGGAAQATPGGQGTDTVWLGGTADGGGGGSGSGDAPDGGCGGGGYYAGNGGQSTQTNQALTTGGTATGYGNDGVKGNTGTFAGQLSAGGGGVGSNGFHGLGAVYNNGGTYNQTKWGVRGGIGTEKIPDTHWLTKAHAAHGVDDEFGEYGFIGGGGGGGLTSDANYGIGSTGASAGGSGGQMYNELNVVPDGIANTGGGGGSRGSGGGVAGAGGSGALYIRVPKVRP